MDRIEPQHLFVLGLVVVATTLVIAATRRRIRRSQADRVDSVQRRSADLHRSSQTTRDVEQVMIELDRLARDIHGRIDTRFAKLERVIRDADERIDQLARLLREAEGGPALDITVGDAPHTPAPLLDSEAPSPRVSASTSDKTTAASAAVRTIHQLADEGKPAVQIAATIGRPIGEVELILSLRRAKSAVQANTPVSS